MPLMRGGGKCFFHSKSPETKIPSFKTPLPTFQRYLSQRTKNSSSGGGMEGDNMKPDVAKRVEDTSPRFPRMEQNDIKLFWCRISCLREARGDANNNHEDI
ncbi:hypothetical protein AVEN_184061-1 [Araneus ventricosus]|uniref:Uncharacterized protein n=1 Tax=Araneus ventricosus TaxID=182803 RepID=A0A4Y2CY31_ARAVE|nr:hypothetical protein AVEN_184061-1 [Araneus ventricosus]